ncbi:MAG TPA: TetR family transcriptional regulator [Candidatus Binatia bacterium]
MPRRSAADAARTRSDILRAARKLFADQGYAATTTGEIAEAAGVTAGALFHHFDGKTALFRSVCEALESEMDAHVREVAGETGGLETFLSGFRAWLEFARRRDFHRIVMFEGPVVLGEAEWRAMGRRVGATTLMEGLELLVAEGVIEKRPLHPLALLLLGAMSEAGFAAARGGSRREVETLVDSLVDAMRYLLTPHLRNREQPVGAATARKRTRRE